MTGQQPVGVRRGLQQMAVGLGYRGRIWVRLETPREAVLGPFLAVRGGQRQACYPLFPLPGSAGKAPPPWGLSCVLSLERPAPCLLLTRNQPLGRLMSFGLWEGPRASLSALAVHRNVRGLPGLERRGWPA